jgi:hypothetical protein
MSLSSLGRGILFFPGGAGKRIHITCLLEQRTTHAEMVGDHHSLTRVHLSSKDHEEQGCCDCEASESDFVRLSRPLGSQLRKQLEQARCTKS